MKISIELPSPNFDAACQEAWDEVDEKSPIENNIKEITFINVVITGDPRYHDNEYTYFFEAKLYDESQTNET